ncbi:MAG: hypothetical protein ACOCX5_04240 [Chloroflexota bacterium]
MTNSEQTEKIRQAIMRYRELLDLLDAQVKQAESNYVALFDQVPSRLKVDLVEKDLQREAALIAVQDMEPLRRYILQVRFNMRDMERAFEELFDNIAVVE